MITEKRLKELVIYDPITGVFTWRVYRAHNALAGDIAGTISVHGYTILTLDDLKYRAGRLAFLYMTGLLPKKQVDHINRIATDDRWCNLREASQIENQCNKSTNNKVIGLLRESNCKWRVYGTAKAGKQPHIGMFLNHWDAVCARKSWEFANEGGGTANE